MKWAQYYERFWEWSESTRIARISALTDFEASYEVEEIAYALKNEKAACGLVRRAIRMGVCFTPDEIIGLASVVDQKTLVLAAENRAEAFTGEEMDAFQTVLEDEKVIRRIRREDGLPKGKRGLFGAAERVHAFGHSSDSGGFFAKLFGAGRRHSGRCEGDCAHCPAHYGYRYGRWYYGHDHVHGCEFGGNRGGGGL